MVFLPEYMTIIIKNSLSLISEVLPMQKRGEMFDIRKTVGLCIISGKRVDSSVVNHCFS
jgi:hypothetical protein